jgi:hypothetical protein
MANNSLSVLDFNNNGIRFQERNGQLWVSLTDMAKASGKLVADWNRLTTTKEYLHELESVMGIPITETTQGGIPENQGSWAVKQVALKFAAWCSVRFEIWVYQQIETLLSTGKVELEQSNPELPPSDIRVVQIVSALEKIGLELNNPRFNQALKDLACDILGFNQNKLPAVENKEIWCGVAERAEQLGYPVAAVTRFRSPLGKFVKGKGLVSKMEKRLCGGTEREINLYQVCERLDNSIHAYMKTKFLP